MDLARGIIEIEGERFYPGYTFEEFKRSHFYTDQDGILFIKLDHPIQIKNHTYLISICFMDYELDLLSLCCIDKEIPFEREIERKSLHDQILAEQGFSPVNNYPWGSVTSSYDPRGNCCDINIVYNTPGRIALNKKNKKSLWQKLFS